LLCTNEVEQWYIRHNYFYYYKKIKIVVPDVPLLYFISTI